MTKNGGLQFNTFYFNVFFQRNQFKIHYINVLFSIQLSIVSDCDVIGTCLTVFYIFSFPPPFITGKNSNQWLLDSYQLNFSHWLPSSTSSTIKK